jgi:hypothetical protein
MPFEAFPRLAPFANSAMGIKDGICSTTRLLHCRLWLFDVMHGPEPTSLVEADTRGFRRYPSLIFRAYFRYGRAAGYAT